MLICVSRRVYKCANDLKETKISFSRSLSILITHLSRANLQLATTLDFWQKQYDIREEAPGQTLDLLEAVDLSALSFQQSVLDTPSVNTRAGLFIFLNAMVMFCYLSPLDWNYIITNLYSFTAVRCLMIFKLLVI